MTDAFFFGAPPRALYGTLHATTGASRGAVVVCQPLLQEGIRCHRALWSLGNALADAGVDVLRFDWFGSGDSDGESAQVSLDGWIDDVQAAIALLLPAVDGLRVLAMRSSVLPVLAHAVRGLQPVDLVLWDPWFSGSEMLDHWQRHHAMQFDGVGRYTSGRPAPDTDALQGFDIAPATLLELASLEVGALTPPAGSHVVFAVWESTPALQRLIAGWRAAGVTADILVFDAKDRPEWDDANAIESQAFPRRSVLQLASRLAGDWP
jgi:uncharacterized protein